MDKTLQRNSFIVVLLLSAAVCVLTFSKDVLLVEKTGIRLNLPDTTADYKGMRRLFCQNLRCSGNSVSIEDKGDKTCALCGSPLDEISLGEKGGLPADTIILKRQYVNPAGVCMSVWAVIGGRDQKSIHRPQQCLPAQGLVIERRRILEVPIAGRAPLKVMLLDVRSSGASAFARPAAFAYWFVGSDRETPYHLQRLFWMASDRVLHGVNHRWAYIAVSTDLRGDSNADVEELRSFIAALYPLVSLRSGQKVNQ
jgi:hypothetical protein